MKKKTIAVQVTPHVAEAVERVKKRYGFPTNAEAVRKAILVLDNVDRDGTGEFILTRINADGSEERVLLLL